MPTKRNDFKEFAIGSNIEYNGKLYEVVRGKYCDGCSIASICSSNDITSGNRIGYVLSRDKRLSIFGECSEINRKDNKSVIFKEIHKDIPVIDNYKVKPLYAGNNKSQLRPIEFEMPKGFIIDTENSDLSKGIIRFKRNWLSIQEIYKALYDRGEVTYRENLKDFSNTKMLAIANLMDIALYFNKYWRYDITDKDSRGYTIYYNHVQLDSEYGCNLIDLYTSVYYGTPVFKNKDDADYVINNPNFKAVLDKIFKS